MGFSIRRGRMFLTWRNAISPLETFFSIFLMCDWNVSLWSNVIPRNVVSVTCFIVVLLMVSGVSAVIVLLGWMIMKLVLVAFTCSEFAVKYEDTLSMSVFMLCSAWCVDDELV